MFDAFVKLTLQRAKGEITPVNPTYIIYSATEWDFYKNCLLASVGKDTTDPCILIYGIYYIMAWGLSSNLSLEGASTFWC